LEKSGSIVLETEVSKVLEYCRESFQRSEITATPVTLTTSVNELIDYFSKGIQRVPVIDSQMHVLNVISQSDLLRFVCENLFLISECGKQSIEELGIINTNIVKVIDLMTTTAIASIASKRINAVAIVDIDGHLIGNFSASDLKGIEARDYPNLLRSITQYLSIFNAKSLYPLTCERNSSLEYVVLKMIASHVHHLWCIDQNKKVIGEVSMTDVIKPFLATNTSTSQIQIN